MVCHNYSTLLLYRESSHRSEEFQQWQEPQAVKKGDRPNKDCLKLRVLAGPFQAARVRASLYAHAQWLPRAD